MVPKKYRIRSVRLISRNVKTFWLEPEDGSPLDFKAGQFVKVFDKDKTIFRPYSIASAPDKKGIELCIKVGHHGKFTTLLDKLGEGDELWIEGPLGNFYYDQQENCVFIAGGAGIAPLIGMIREIAKKGKKGKFVLLYSNKKIEDIAYLDELNEIASKNNEFRVVFTLTQEEREWDQEKGRIDQKMISKYVKSPEENSWYICGPVLMVNELKTAIVKLGGKPEKIKVEGWG